MEYSSKQDFGNLGNLVVYLNGKQNISERLKIGKKIFYISSKMPPQHKEEVIIVWLMDILSTNKVLTFSDEEVVLIWRTLREFFSSKRLKGLCLNHWICPITPPFVQTLMRTSCEIAPREIQQEALSICECLLKMSTFSPQIMILTKQSFRLLTGVLKLTLETHSFSLFQSLIIMLLQKVTFVISNEMTKGNVMSLVFENQALNLLEILFELKKKNSECSELIKEIENYLNLVLFADESMNGYSRIFDLNIFKINESSSLRIGESFYSFISALLTKSDKEKAAYILKEFYTCFFQTFKRSEELIFYAINVSMHILGISYESGVVEVEKSASPSMIPVKLNKIHKYMFASCILESLLLAEVNVEFTSSEVSFKDFINSLFRELILQKHPNEFMLQSLIFIIRMGPYLISEHLDLFGNLLLLNREDSSLNEKVDEIFCIILSLNLKCRTVDEFLEKLSNVLLSLDENQLPLSILQNDLKTLFLRKNSFLPYKFLKNLLSAIKGMGTMASMNIWSSLHKILSTTCHPHLQTLSSSKCLLKVSYIIWLSSCCLNTTSIIDVSMPKSISGVISVFDLFASDCIEPLVSEMSQITIEGKWELLQALLSLILVWSEIHCTLCLSSNKYRKETKFPLRSEVEEENFKDLKSLIPFFDQSSFEKFSFLNEEEDTSRSYIIQILIKRLSLSRLQESEIRVRETLPKSSTVTKVVDYILDVRDPSLFPLSSDILALHMHSFLPFLKKKNFLNLARYFVSGIEKNKELWIKFGKSQTFRENESLQIQIFSLLSTNVLSLFSSKKRKLDEDASEELSKAQILNSLLLKRLTSVQENQTKFASDFILILSDLEALLKIHGVNCLKSKNEKQILTILQTLEMFPLSFLQPRFLMSTLTLTVIIAHNVGNISSQKKVGPAVVNILHRIALSPNIFFIFKFSKNIPYFLLLWLVDECRELMNHSHIEDYHLKAILLMKERLDLPKDTLHGLLNILYLFTLAFVEWNESGLLIKSYTQNIVNLSTKTDEVQALYLATSILICSIEKNLDGKVTQSKLDLVTYLCSWTLESSEKMTLSHVTKVPFVWVLLTFCQTMKIQMKLQTCGKQIKKSLSESPQKIGQIECATLTSNLLLNWNSIIETGLKFATLAVETEDKNLRKLALEFYLNACDISKSVDNVDVWDISHRIWQIMFTYEDHYIQEEKFFQILSPKQSLSVFKILVDGIQSDGADLLKLLKWLNAFIGSNQGLQNDQHFKSSSLFDELVISLCVKFSDENSSQSVPPYVQIFKLLSSLLQTNYPISNNAKSLILGLISNCTFKNISSDECFESLQELAKLLNLFLFKEHSLMNKRPSSFMSALTNAILILLNKNAEEEEFSQHKLKEVEKCCLEIEKVTKNLKQFSRDIFKIAAFSLSSVLEEMQKKRILPVVKLSMERIIYNLIDSSDPHSLEHLLVTLSPSAVTLLQYFYKSFNKSFKFDPRKA